MFHSRILLLSSIILIFIGSQDLMAAARRVSSVTNVSFGSYEETDGHDSVSGSQWSLGFKYFLSDSWAYFLGVESGKAEGQHQLTDGKTVPLEAEKTSFSGGLQWHWLFDDLPELTPYVGAGITIRRYRYDFNYSNSPIGVTSGTGYGPLLSLGVKVDLAEHFLIIPGYQYEQVTIETENGAERAVTSSGFWLALVIRF